jgi:hypothetical protein
MNTPAHVFRRRTLRARLEAWDVALRERLGRVTAGLANAETRGPALRRAGMIGGVAAVVLGVGAYFVFRAVPQPDYDADGLDDVFNYTLLTDEFNQLPVEERLKLIGKLVQRLKNMSAGDSMLLASFAAGIESSARQQLEENGSRLAVDVWDKYAKNYGAVPEAEREAYLEQSFVEFTKLMEAVAGSPRDISDAERLAEAKRQAKRDSERMRDPERGPDAEGMGDFLGFVNNTVASRATPQQRVRGQQMARDMVRMFREQDVETGKPAPGGG